MSARFLLLCSCESGWGLRLLLDHSLAAIEEFGELDDIKFANKIVGTFMKGGILLIPEEMKALVKDIVKEIDTLKGNSYNQLSIEEKKKPMLKR